MALQDKRPKSLKDRILPSCGGLVARMDVKSACQRNGWVHLPGVFSAHQFPRRKWLKSFDAICRSYNGSALMEGFTDNVFGNGLHHLQGTGVDFQFVLRTAFITHLFHSSEVAGYAIHRPFGLLMCSVEYADRIGLYLIACNYVQMYPICV